jgi:hypothetical protein
MAASMLGFNPIPFNPIQFNLRYFFVFFCGRRCCWDMTVWYSRLAGPSSPQYTMHTPFFRHSQL